MENEKITPTIVHAAPSVAEKETGLLRRLGLFDATMIVMGGIIGSGIFMNPSVVAKYVQSPLLILGAWIVGGLIALAGAFIYAELAARRPLVGGQYAYLREAYHPIVAFLFGWTLFLVSDTGGMAAVGITFARYFIELTGVPFTDKAVAVSALSILTIINCFGVRAGSNVQNTLMVTKLIAIFMLIGAGILLFGDSQPKSTITLDAPISFDLFTTFGAALVPVLFAYGGWQTANFIAGEIKEPQKNLPRGLLIGVIGVIVIYLSVNFISVNVLGPQGLAATSTPASEVMRIALGEKGAKLIAIGIAISTLGFLSQCVLVAPRVYFAMAADGLFFKKMAWIHPKTCVPVFAIALQGLIAIIIALSGTYEEILSYVVSNDFIFFGLTASCIFVLRCRRTNDNPDAERFNMPGHPITTSLFIAICIFVVVNTLYKYPINSLIGFGIILAGIPVYYFWRWYNKST
ncbi:MAG: amino acid permease [Ignavibacteriae bacterium]|nr:amino acid permease [Ignavibacteriota bacterium]